METKQSPHLKRVLKSYQLTAANTMNGPNSVMPRLENTSNLSSMNGQLTNIHKKRISLDGPNGLLFPGKDLIQSLKQQQKANPVFNRSISQNVNSSSYINLPKLSGIKKEPVSPSNGSTLIIKSTAATMPTLLPPPILTAPDRSKTEKKETVLEGETIACFMVGGEPRLCFPQILTSVLRGFSLNQINQVCDELQIFCSRCSPEQLELLKLTAVIPPSAPSCGLITKTDAERLVNSLLHRNPPKAAVSVLSAVNRPQDPNKPNSVSHFRVYHECFGKGRGVLLPHLYEKPDSLCIECIDCHGLFSPPRFVCHSHHHQENRTCHWGFDPAKWRNYLMVAKDQENRDKLSKTLQDFKMRFDCKRKESGSSLPTEEGSENHVVIKRIRYSSEPVSLNSLSNSSQGILSSEALSVLPTKKRIPFLHNSDIQQQGGHGEINSVKKLLLAEMSSSGAEIVINMLDKMSRKISGLEQICRNQEEVLRDITKEAKPTNPSTELQAKVSTMEAELHSLKKQLLRRHGEEGL